MSSAPVMLGAKSDFTNCGKKCVLLTISTHRHELLSLASKKPFGICCGKQKWIFYISLQGVIKRMGVKMRQQKIKNPCFKWC